MFTPQTQTFMQAVVTVEIDEFAKSFDPNKLIEYGDDAFFKGNVLFKTLPFRSSFQNLLTHSKVITDRSKLVNDSYPESTHYRSLMDDVTKEIITISKNTKFKDAMIQIQKVKDALKEKFYGALLISKKIILNPLHPLTAMSIIDSKEYSEETRYRVVVFVYQNRPAMDKKYSTENADPKIIQENLTDMINCFSNTIDSEIKVVGYEIESSGNLQMKYKIKKYADEDDENEYMMVAHQILTKGIVLPYYGTSIVKLADSTSGVNVSPMISCNISHDRSFGSGTTFDSPQIKDTKDIQISYKSVCCGSLNNKTLKGLRSLTHSNASSPYNTEIISDGSLAYVEACNDKSIEIYTLAGILSEPEVEIIIDPKHKIGGKLVNRLNEANAQAVFDILSEDGIILTKEQKIDLEHIKHRLERIKNG